MKSEDNSVESHVGGHMVSSECMVPRDGADAHGERHACHTENYLR